MWEAVIRNQVSWAGLGDCSGHSVLSAQTDEDETVQKPGFLVPKTQRVLRERRENAAYQLPHGR